MNAMYDEPREQTRNSILSFVRDYLNTHGYAPARREIAAACYVSPSSVDYNLAVLRAQGRLTYQTGKIRSIQLTEAA